MKRFKARIYSLFIHSVILHLLFHFNLSYNLKDEHDLVIQFFEMGEIVAIIGYNALS